MPTGDTQTPRPERLRPLLYWHYDLDAVIAACVFALLLGMMLALPLRVEEKASTLNLRPFGVRPPAVESRQEIIKQLTEIEDRHKQLERELAQERQLKQDLEAMLTEKDAVASGVIEDLQRARLVAGLVPAEGPGIVLKLTEHPKPGIAVEDVAQSLIHQEDLLNIVNELWSAGAEALAIRSAAGTERLATASSIRCVGPVVIVNAQRMGPPFEILAIGNGPTLRQALEIPNGVLSVLSHFDIEYEIREEPALILPAYSGKSFPEYARVHKEALATAGSAADTNVSEDE